MIKVLAHPPSTPMHAPSLPRPWVVLLGFRSSHQPHTVTNSSYQLEGVLPGTF